MPTHRRDFLIWSAMLGASPTVLRAIDDAAFDSPAQKAGLDWDQEVLRVLRPASVPSKYWMFIPALALLALVVMMQRRRVPGLRRAEA